MKEIICSDEIIRKTIKDQLTVIDEFEYPDKVSVSGYHWKDHNIIKVKSSSFWTGEDVKLKIRIPDDEMNNVDEKNNSIVIYDKRYYDVAKKICKHYDLKLLIKCWNGVCDD